jgi:hypothetical protein
MLGEVWKLSAAAIARILDNIPRLGYAAACSWRGKERAANVGPKSNEPRKSFGINIRVPSPNSFVWQSVAAPAESRLAMGRHSR